MIASRRWSANLNMSFSAGFAGREELRSRAVYRRLVDPLLLRRAPGLLSLPCRWAGGEQLRKLVAQPSDAASWHARWFHGSRVPPGEHPCGTAGTGSRNQAGVCLAHLVP